MSRSSGAKILPDHSSDDRKKDLEINNIEIYPLKDRDNVGGKDFVNFPTEDQERLNHKYEEEEIDKQLGTVANWKPLLKPSLFQTSNSYKLFPFLQSDGIHEKLFLHSKYAYPFIRKSFVLTILFILGMVSYLIFYVWDNDIDNISTKTYYNNGNNIPTYRLTLIGDSLIHRPFKEFNLGGRLQHRFTTVNLNITENAESDQTIAECYQNINADVPFDSADMVILYWDTDVSDYNEYAMADEEIAIKRSYYRSNLTAVINAVQAANVSKMAISGPTILGEGLFFRQYLYVSRENKKSMLNDYRQINIDIAEELGVDYIDMRKAYLQALPAYWFFPAYHLTLDGEHPNDRGTGIIVKQFAKQISEWTGAPVKS